MNRIERSAKDIWSKIPLFFIWLTLMAQTLGFLRTKNGAFDLNPLNILMLGITLFLGGAVMAHTVWLCKNPFAVIKQDDLIICLAPFKKEILNTHDIVKVREILTREKEIIFGFKYEYDKWILMFDCSNNLTTTLSLGGYLKKRNDLIKLLSDNNITVENAS